MKKEVFTVKKRSESTIFLCKLQRFPKFGIVADITPPVALAA